MSVHAKTTITTATEFVVSVPALLGFHPRDSLIMIMRDSATADFRGGARIDLPSPGDATAVAAELRRPVRPGMSVELLVVGGGHVADGNGLPHVSTIATVVEVMESGDVPVLHTIWAAATQHGAEARLYAHPDTPLSVPDPKSTAVAAKLALLGYSVRESREAIEDCLTHTVGQEELARRARRIRALVADIGEARTQDPSGVVADGVAEVKDALAAAHHGALPDADEAMRLAALLRNGVVRDHAIAACASQPSGAVEQLLCHLVRHIPAPYRVNAALLLAIVAYLRGDGVLARCALGIALDTRPRNRLAALLQAELDSGTRPETIAEFIAEATGSLEPPTRSRASAARH